MTHPTSSRGPWRLVVLPSVWLAGAMGCGLPAGEEEVPVPDEVVEVAGAKLPLFHRDTGRAVEYAPWSGEVVRLHHRNPDGTGFEGVELRPSTNVTQPGEAEGKAHTNLRVFVPSRGFDLTPPRDEQRRQATDAPRVNPSASSPAATYDTPASLACFYGLVPPPAGGLGCNAQVASVNPTGGYGPIAIVTAFHHPTVVNDATYFSNFYGLPAPKLSVVYATTNGVQPPPSPAGWDLETALDVQWAHAMAPDAPILLVETASDIVDDMIYNGVEVAKFAVGQLTYPKISMSWGAKEYSTESKFESVFSSKPTVYAHCNGYSPCFPYRAMFIAASGDDGSTPTYPATSKYVMAVGGTTVSNPYNPPGTTSPLPMQEFAWNRSGGGVSTYITKPSYQAALNASMRATPDVSLVATVSGNGGVPVYVSGQGGWNIAGGTSLSAPLMAGLLSRTQTSYTWPSTYYALQTLYTAGVGSNPSYFRDITAGSCGVTASGSAANPYSAAPGFDLCTGWGSKVGPGGL